MQNAKDTLYLMLQSRLAALNPSRTMVARGVVRPGILVDENELPTASVAANAFRLRWTAMQVHSASPLPWVAMECSIEYATDGSPDKGGMDRGRLLAAMDAELAAALAAEPRSARSACSDGDEYLLGRSGLRRGLQRGRAIGPHNNGAGLRLPGSR